MMSEVRCVSPVRITHFGGRDRLSLTSNLEQWKHKDSSKQEQIKEKVS